MVPVLKLRGTRGAEEQGSRGAEGRQTVRRFPHSNVPRPNYKDKGERAKVKGKTRMALRLVVRLTSHL